MINVSTPATNVVALRPFSLSPIRRFQTAMVVGDAAVIAVAVFISHIARFGLVDVDLAMGFGTLVGGYLAVSILIACVWLLLLRGLHTYRERILGAGTEEYKRVTEATVALFGGIAIASYIFQIELSRRYFLLMFPIGLIGLHLWRWVARRLLVSRRAQGRYCHNALIVGSTYSSESMLAELARRPEMGVRFVGACLSCHPGDIPATLGDGAVPVVGGIQDIVDSLTTLHCDTLVITASPELTAAQIRRIGWSVDPNTQVILAPSIVDVAGPRMHLRPVDGLSLVEVTMPRFDGVALFVKRAIDIVASTLLIALLIPAWLVISILIKLDDHGPVFFRQVRIGQGGREFRIFKFRSMRVNADAELTKLLEAQGTADKPLFKVDNDPRITKLGAFLRKTSLDELPQLFNVFAGTMTLVGPRPQVPAEVALYDEVASRRLLVKPGVTGLWQVNGRSKLSWEEAIRYDLYYVENWTLTGDLQILFRTVKVVLGRDGSQ